MSKFEVGRHYRIVSSKHFPTHNFNCGDIVKAVESSSPCPEVCKCVRPDKHTQWVNVEDVEPVGYQKIVVTTDGKTVTAKAFDGKAVVKSAEAKCSPQDTFDFEKGAALALDRLLGREKQEEKKLFPLEDIKAGYLLRVKDTNSGEEFNMTVVPGLTYGCEGMGVCCPDKHWWALSRFNDDLTYPGDTTHKVMAVYGYCHNRFLLDNTTEDRKLLWSRE